MTPSRPPTILPSRTQEQQNWWNDWVQLVRNSPALIDRAGEETHFWGEHLFIGEERHNNLFRSKRAVGVAAKHFSDAIEYNDVSDLRSWEESKPATLLLHEGILAEHCYIVGPSGSGKTSLGIMPILMQLLRGAKTRDERLSDPYPMVIIDLKGDAALFNTVKHEAARRGQPFKFFTTEKNAPTYRFNPFRGFDRESRSVAQLCQLILDSLSLNHGKGYGRSYYTERSRNVLSSTLHKYKDISSFEDLHECLTAVLRSTSDTRAKNDAFELLSIIEMLKEYKQLVTGPNEDVSKTDGVIFMPNVLRNREVAYFWLPAALESISVGEIAKLVLFNLRTAAQDWKRQNPKDPRRVILVIDELQRVAGENLQGILQDARSFGISAILANQSLKDLQSPTGFDLAPTIMTNTRVKFFFTSPAENECYVFVERGKGFTAPRPYPQQGNPWLKDLAPEEFGYHARLAWPLPLAEYQERDATNLPSWDEVPGGCWIVDSPSAPKEPPTASLPWEHSFALDDEWKRQAAAIDALFENTQTSQEDALDRLFDE
jgi:type IV secretory pathway VirB4 component